jgi:hypothetical protein
MSITDLMAGYASYTTAADLSACRGLSDATGRETTSVLTPTILLGDVANGVAPGYWPNIDSNGEATA